MNDHHRSNEIDLNKQSENKTTDAENHQKNQYTSKSQDVSKSLSLIDLEDSFTKDHSNKIQSKNSMNPKNNFKNSTNYSQHCKTKHPNSPFKSDDEHQSLSLKFYSKSRNSSTTQYSLSYHDDNSIINEKNLRREKRKRKLLSDFKKYQTSTTNNGEIIKTDSKRFDPKTFNGSPISAKTDVYPRLYIDSIKEKGNCNDNSPHTLQNEFSEYFKPEPKTIKQPSPHLYASKKEIQIEQKIMSKTEENLNNRKICFGKKSQKLSQNTPSLLLREKTSIDDVFETVRAQYERERMRKEYLKRFDPD